MEGPHWKQNVDISEALNIQESAIGGYGVFAQRDIPVDEVVMKIPKTSVLSSQNSGLASKLMEYSDLEPTDLLIVSYLLEKHRGSSSPWCYFIEFVSKLPIPDVPTLWQDGEQDWLAGTNINIWAVATIDDIKEYYSRCQKLLSDLKDRFPEPISFNEFRDAALLVSSRAFDVDNYHGLAFVPGACFFNHSDKESVHFETDGVVCEKCGGLDCECSSDDEWEEDEADESEENSDNSSDGFVDVEDDSESEAEVKSESGEKNNSIRETNEEREYDNICEMRTTRSVQAGEELFNTYGEDPNGVLLARYGFAIWNNLHDVVDFDEELEEFANANKAQKTLQSWRSKQEVKAEEEEDEELLFVGIINGPEKPKISSGLNSLASKLKMTEKQLVKLLAEKRYEKYTLEGTSAQLKQQADEEQNIRKRTALIAVGSEKLLLEGFLV